MSRELTREQQTLLETAASAAQAWRTAIVAYQNAVVAASVAGIPHVTIGRAVGSSGENIRKMVRRRETVDGVPE